MATKNELYETKLDKAGEDINETIKHINKLKEIREKLDYQYTKTTELESELNEKDKYINTLKKDIENLKNRNTEIMIE